MLTNAERRGELFRECWRSIGRIFLLAMVLDIIYQLIVERFVYPLELLITAVLLAIFPFLIVRACVSHIVSLFIGRGRAKSYAKNSSK
jgi:hypothetical protein